MSSKKRKSIKQSYVQIYSESYDIMIIKLTKKK